jgi:hypothetical protein
VIPLGNIRRPSSVSAKIEKGRFFIVLGLSMNAFLSMKKSKRRRDLSAQARFFTAAGNLPRLG